MKLTIDAVPPFDFELSANIFSDGDEQIRKYEGGEYWQVIQVNSKLVLATISSSGKHRRTTLHLAVGSSFQTMTFSHESYITYLVTRSP